MSAVRRHIIHKRDANELHRAVAERMLTALEANPTADYAQLYRDAVFMSPPRFVYHTSPVVNRDSILVRGLLPGDGRRNWGRNALSQPLGVYVAAEPDGRGIWAPLAVNTWDVWRADIQDLQWGHDTLNPGCWFVRGTIIPSRLTYDNYKN